MITFDPKTQTVVVDAKTGSAYAVNHLDGFLYPRQLTAVHWMTEQMAKLKKEPVKYEHSSFVPQRPTQRDVMVGWDGV